MKSKTMNKVIIILLIGSLFPMLVFSQVEKEVDNGIFVTFPTTPEYSINQNNSTYVAKTSNCFFMVLLQRNIIPNYNQYVLARKNWTKAEIKKVESSFLDNAVKGKLDYTGNTGIVSEIIIGKYRGRKIEYSAINPATGERGKRFSIMLLVRDKLINFDCWLLNNTSNSTEQKDEFFRSIIEK